MTELEFYEGAKKHFRSRKITVPADKDKVALCGFLYIYCLPYYMRQKIRKDIRASVEKSWENHHRGYRNTRNIAYFFNHKCRMAFINKRIKELKNGGLK